MSTQKKILLHSCCAPCASASLERLLEADYEVTLFFSNSNIFPREEYEKRLESMRDLAQSYHVTLHIDAWDHSSWLACVAGLENEPEKGKRCLKCFEFSFRRTQIMANNLKIFTFASTLSISPHKPSKILFEIGSQFPGFLAMDFKKKNGFQRSLELTRTHSLYRQRYCGCEFTLRS
ncbi:MAG: epoxyqueuosine reductase QueH [Deltaproteobacteria bacterium]|nr:epoxyqueuosine reductase QueH [Deltaproteobacteria bacterium]